MYTKIIHGRNESDPQHTFDLEGGGIIQLTSGATLPHNIKKDTKLWVPAHDYWPCIPGSLFVLSTFGEIHDCHTKAFSDEQLFRLVRGS